MLPDSSTIPESVRERILAQQQLDYIVELERSPAFQKYFMPRIREKILSKQAAILRGSLSPEDYPAERAAFIALTEVERMIVDDAIGCRNILGIEKDELPCMQRLS